MNKENCHDIINKFFININEFKSYKEDFFANSDNLLSHIIYLEQFNEKEKNLNNFYLKNKDKIKYCFNKYYKKQ